jgi:AraC-like DNA-binding protein
MELVRREPASALNPYLNRPLEGWTVNGTGPVRLREVPFPGVPLVFNLGARWTIDGEVLDSFVAGLHRRPALVQGSASFSCIEVRLSPLGARRLLGMPMCELADRTIALDHVFPRAGELTERLRAAPSWAARFDLVEDFLVRRIDTGPAPPREIEWSWQRLLQSGGRTPIRSLAEELGWSPRSLIARFREQIGLAPKTAARVIRFDRAATALRAGGSVSLAGLAYECGYSDQAHLNRDFRELAGTTPTEFASSLLESGGIAA